MCRFLLYQGRVALPLSDLLVEPEHALCEQAFAPKEFFAPESSPISDRCRSPRTSESITGERPDMSEFERWTAQSPHFS